MGTLEVSLEIGVVGLGAASHTAAHTGLGEIEAHDSDILNPSSKQIQELPTPCTDTRHRDTSIVLIVGLQAILFVSVLPHTYHLLYR